MGPRCSNKLFQYRHAYGDTVFHLLKNDRLRVFHHFTVNFDIPVDRRRVHDDGMRFQQSGPG